MCFAQWKLRRIEQPAVVDRRAFGINAKSDC
jgi:hypothetical protein